VDPNSTFLWDGLRRLTRALSVGDRAMDLAAYNGSLFSPEDLPGAGLLDRAEVSDAHLARALDAVGFDYRRPEDEVGLDYAQLEIGHLGAIYEGLLALRLSLADQTYAWNEGRKRFVPSETPGEDGVAAGQLYFQTEAGGRKGGGVFYTRQELVRHLVSQSVLPALEEHLEQVRKRAADNPADAARLLFRFRVLDPAMGSAHFLVDALDVITERVDTFLAETPLPAIKTRLEELRSSAGATESEVEDGRLLKRLLLKHCIYGVDVQEMAAELGRIALWLASFVPGLALSYLDHNVRHGNSLVGVATFNVLAEPALGGGGKQVPAWAIPGGALHAALQEASERARELADLEDRTPEEVRQSRERAVQLQALVSGAQRAFDLWTAEAFGVRGARGALIDAAPVLSGKMPPDIQGLVDRAQSESRTRSFLHWPLAFPEVFHPSSERNPGFDAVIGNPPWDEITVERLGFLALHDPGLRGISSRTEQEQRIADLLVRYPDLEAEFRLMQLELEVQRSFFKPENGYEIQGAGDLDLYELFCERYQTLTREGGRIGVVQPRSTFLAEGSQAFRRWLYSRTAVERIDFLLNKARWAFDMEPRYTVALLAAHVVTPPKGHLLRITGPSDSPEEFRQAAASNGVPVALDDLASWTPAPPRSGSTQPTWELPLLPTADHARIFAKLRQGPRFDALGLAHGGVFPATELHETQQKSYFRHNEGVPVWKGASFDQCNPHGREIAGHADWEEVFSFLQAKRERSRTFRDHFGSAHLKDPKTHPIHRARIAFRDVTNRTNSRTVLACLIPPRTPLTNKAPYLVFPDQDEQLQAYALGVLNSVPFDWQARRIVETNLNFFILNFIAFPPDESGLTPIAERAAALSCIHEGYAAFAKAVGVGIGSLSLEQRTQCRAEIDALVAHAYGLTAGDLAYMFTDFPSTPEGLPADYRALVLERFEALA
jgi:hypothetical protein